MGNNRDDETAMTNAKPQTSAPESEENPEPPQKRDPASVAEEITAELKAALEQEDAAAAGADEQVILPEADQSEEIARLKDQLLRAVAETENIRKRAERDLSESRKYAVTGFARDMVNVVENLQLALQNIPEEDRKTDQKLNALAEGVALTYNELIKTFDSHGIKRLEPVGEKFDHNFHQAVAQVEDPKAVPGTVVQVLQAGYVIHDRLLRPAMVTVAKGGGDAPQVDTQA